MPFGSRKREPTSSISVASSPGPGADPVSLDEELRRVMPVIEGLVGRTRARVSVDTRKAEVMRRAVAGGRAYPERHFGSCSTMHSACGWRPMRGCPSCSCMRTGDPRTMQRDPRYDDVLLDVYDMLEARVEACERAGIPRERLIVDPGIGFGKSAAHNLALLAGLSFFHALGTPVTARGVAQELHRLANGCPRPLGARSGVASRRPSRGGCTGHHILRVHDVAATRQALAVWEAALAGTARIYPGHSQGAEGSCPRPAIFRYATCGKSQKRTLNSFTPTGVVLALGGPARSSRGRCGQGSRAGSGCLRGPNVREHMSQRYFGTDGIRGLANKAPDDLGGGAARRYGCRSCFFA